MSECNCADCPLVAARASGEAGGSAAEAHALRLKLSEYVRKLALARQKMIHLGVDPDLAYPHDERSNHG